MVNLHIDYNSLFTEAKNGLVLSSLSGTETNIENLLSSFRKNETGIEQGYFCPLFVHDKKDDCYYPVVFFSSQEHRILSRKAVFNHYFLDCFASLGADISYFDQEKDIKGIHDALQDEIDVHKIFDKAEVIICLCPIDEDVVQYNTVYPILKNRISNKTAEENKEASIGLSVSYDDGQEEHSFFHKEHSLLNHIEEDKFSVLIYDDDGIIDDFIIKMIRSIIRKKQNAVIVSSKEIKDEIMERFHHKPVGPYIDSFLKVENRQEVSPITEEFMMDEERYFSFDNKKKEIFYSEKTEDFIGYDPSFHGIDLNIDEYDKDDFSSDKETLDFIRNCHYCSKYHGSDMPFYGISVPATEESYAQMHVYLSVMNDDIRYIQKQIESHPFFENYEVKINNLNESVIKGEDAYLLREYNGFPKKYFSLNNQDEENHPLVSLKNLFQSISSSRLVIQNLCIPEIFDIDITALVKEYNNAGFLNKWLVEKKIAKYLKSRKTADVKTIVRVLSSYIESVRFADQVLPEYISLYGESVSNMNGVVEIESNVDYINRFKEREKEDPEFNLEKPFIKRCIKDKEFRNSNVNVMISIYEHAKEIMEVITRLKVFFRIDEQEMKEKSFDDFLSYCQEKSSYSFEEFEESAKLAEIITKSSMTLQLALRKYDMEKRSMESFVSDFMSTLIYQHHQKKENAFLSYQEGYQEAYQKYVSNYDRLAEEIYYDTLQMNNDYLDSIRSDLRYVDRISSINERIKNRMMEPEDEILLSFYKNPVYLCDKDAISGIEKKVFDNLILINSNDLDDAELLSASEIADKLIIININNHKDHRVLGLKEEYLSNESIYSHAFDFTKISKEFMKKMSSVLLEKQFFLSPDDPYFPLVAIDMSTKKKYALLPDSVIISDYDSYSMSELRHYLYLQKNMALIEFMTTRFFFDENELIGKLK